MTPYNCDGSWEDRPKISMIRQWTCDVIVWAWPIMPHLARLWAFMNDNIAPHRVCPCGQIVYSRFKWYRHRLRHWRIRVRALFS